MQIKTISALIAALAFSTCATAHDYQAGDLRVAHPQSRPTVAGQTSGAAYLTLANQGTRADKLVGLTSPVAKSVEIHTMSMDGNVMKMREVAAIELKPGETVAMNPGDGFHLMLIGLKQALKVGDKFPLTLRFEKAGKLDVSVWVEEAKTNAADKAGSAHQH